MRRITLICDACHEVITEPNHCTPHDKQLPAFDDVLGDTHYHVECCPECQAEDEDAKWREFVANELFHESAEGTGL